MLRDSVIKEEFNINGWFPIHFISDIHLDFAHPEMASRCVVVSEAITPSVSGNERFLTSPCPAVTHHKITPLTRETFILTPSSSAHRRPILVVRGGGEERIPTFYGLPAGFSAVCVAAICNTVKQQ